MPTSTNTPPSSSSSSELPWAFHDCSTETLVILISHMLNLLIQHNDQVILTPDSLTRFHSKSAPDIKVLDYLNRIVKYTNMEKIPLLSLLAYIDVTCTNLPTFTLSSLTVHRFLIAGVCAGSKAQCDVFCTNSHYAKVGGIQIKELNALEMEFLKVTQWDLCCKAELLQRYYTSLIKSHGGYTQADEPADNPFTKLPQPRAGSSTGAGSIGVPDIIPPTAAGDEREDTEATSATDNATTSSRAGNTNPQPADAPLVPRKRGIRHANNPHKFDALFQPDPPLRAPSPKHTSRPAPASAPDAGRMEVDVEEDESTSPIDDNDNDRIESSPASSSVPSSSRSSLRTRNVSMSQLDPSMGTAASPRVDMTTASGRVVMDIDREADSEQEDQRASSIDNNHSDDRDGRNSHTTGGKLLKSLVGGIFKRRDSAHHSDPPPPPPPRTESRNGNGNGRLVPPHQSPGRRVKSPLMTSFPQGEPPAMAAPVTPRVRSREETNGC